ncbi:MAG TPA: 2-dehydropantoate 2-reductase [Rhodocyclaceae bacterium]|nr:2-dehydropantoate 2-reductase [Rhodocyclaceae bacterium]HUY02245.1 2-dehydropantoate 2-reductase [Rhodocyclaceae bacterium]
MRICIVGAGSIGGLLGVKLAQAGEEVTLIARGAHLAAIRENGMKLIAEDGAEAVVRLRATERIAEAGVQDLVVLGMKAHQVAAVVHDLPALYHEETAVLTAQNGIPWWYFMKHGGEYEGHCLESVDPGGVIAANLPVDRVLGSVVYPAAEIVAPGVLHHIEGNRFSVGEIDGTETPRLLALAEALRRAGFKAPLLTDIRSEIWTKLWGNLSFNPISALSHATLVDICQFPLTRDLLAKMMSEAQAVGEKLGIRFRVSLEKRIAGAEAVGRHKTSMLQDVEAGRAPEIAALIGSVVELGRITGLPTPHIDAIYAAVSLLARTLQKQHGRLRVEAL